MYVYICVHMYIYSHKRKEILPFATTWMGLEGIMQCEKSQANTNTCITCRWNVKTLNHGNKEQSGGSQ